MLNIAVNLVLLLQLIVANRISLRTEPCQNFI